MKTDFKKGDETTFSSNLDGNEMLASTECMAVEKANFEKHETLFLFNKFDFVWPGAIERLKVADTRKK